MIGLKNLRHLLKREVAELESALMDDLSTVLLLDIVKCFKGDEDQYDTSQQYAGFKDLFRGFVVKYWDGADFNCRKHTYLNKILVKKAVLFYSKCWKHRNNVHHDEEK